MVSSKINESVKYSEPLSVFKEDLNGEAELYEISVDVPDMNKKNKSVDIIVAVGKARHEYEAKGILYFPIYLVKKTSSVTPIGVYEIPVKDMLRYLDEDNSLDVVKLHAPHRYRLYNRTQADDILRLRKVPEGSIVVSREKSSTRQKGGKNSSTNTNTKTKTTEKDDEDSEESDSDTEESDSDKEESDNDDDEFNRVGGSISIPEIRKELFVQTEGAVIPPRLREETLQKAREIRERYRETSGESWIIKFLKNDYYAILDNEGGCDSLFASIRDAFSQLGQQTTVQKLRTKLSNEMGEDEFQKLKDLYETYNTALIKDTNEIKEMEKSYADIQNKFGGAVDRNEKHALVDAGRKIQEGHDRLVHEKKVTAEILKEVKFMKGVDTLEKFKKLVKTGDLCGSKWFISTLERVLNIKLIIFSHHSFLEKPADIDNVLQCGEITDAKLEDKDEFKPEFYILLDNTNHEYKLLSYRRKMIFKFSEIPFDVKRMVVDKCMEQNAGLFHKIPDFRDFKGKIYQLSATELAGGGVTRESGVKYDDLTDSKIRGLYDDSTRFVFYNKSGNALPGKGPGEKIQDSLRKQYTTLGTIPLWRRKLADDWEQPFSLDNHTWNSVEHYYQASKFKKNNQPFYLSFSLDSGTDLSQDPVLAKAAGSKTGKYKGELIRPLETEIDPDFFGKRDQKEKYDAQYAKFTGKNNTDLKNLLLFTHNAKLLCHRRAKPPALCENLMMVRDKIRTETDARSKK